MEAAVNAGNSPAAQGPPAEWTEAEVQEVEQALEDLNEAAVGIVGRLDRMHLLLQDIIDELRAARGMSAVEQERSHAAA